MTAANPRDSTKARYRTGLSHDSLRGDEGNISPTRAGKGFSTLLVLTHFTDGILATPDYNSKTPSSPKEETDEPPDSADKKTSDGVPNWVADALADEPRAQPWKKWVVIDENSKGPEEFVVNLGTAEK